MRVLAIASVLLATVGLAQQAATPVQAGAPKYNLVKAGVMAPDFEATTLSGEKIKLSDYRGKVVILDFWASWCGPCMKSMPGTEAIYQQVKDQNVVVLSLNTWDQQPDFKKWVADNSSKYHFDFVRDPAEGDHDAIRKASIAKRLYKVPGIPTIYVIGTDGKIIGGVVGSGNEAEIVKLLSQVGVKASVSK